MLAVLGDLVSLIASDTRQEEPGSAAEGVRRLSRDGGNSPTTCWLRTQRHSASPDLQAQTSADSAMP